MQHLLMCKHFKSRTLTLGRLAVAVCDEVTFQTESCRFNLSPGNTHVVSLGKMANPAVCEWVNDDLCM